MESCASKNTAGIYTPTLIIHGGAGAIRRSHLPPSLYGQYHRSLLHCLTSTKSLLDTGATALDAAVYAVSLMEDDELFNCGHGSVFNLKGEIEMEASVMVATVHAEEDYSSPYKFGDSSNRSGSDSYKKAAGLRKRAAAVSLVQQTRHPIRLAREVLLEGDTDHGEVSTMHCHLSGRDVEEWGWGKGLEKKPKEWFWTRRRWEEHKRGLNRPHVEKAQTEEEGADGAVLPSQGTVGAVCLDRWGNVAVATSTGGLTNKKPGRIGDTPTVGAGFWAESWEHREHIKSWVQRMLSEENDILNSFRSCLAPFFTLPKAAYQPLPQISGNFSSATPETIQNRPTSPVAKPRPELRRAIAMSGTGNGDSFLRTNAARSAGAKCRYDERATSFWSAVAAIAGPGGELQRSAGSRFGSTGEGEGGIIGIEVFSDGSSNVVFDFNCGGMWRAWYENVDGQECPKVMVFRDEYQ